MSDKQTAVARPRAAMPPEMQARIEERRMQNMVAAQIRGTKWGKDLGDAGSRALAEWCRSRGIDPVLHVEVLGGRVYLNADFYREKGAPLVRTGVVKPPVLDHIEADERLDKLAAEGDEWAQAERTRRIRLRIKHNVPEKAKAAVICTIETRNGNVLEGVNWCGGGVKTNDPVGEAEPSKTAESRAERRAWRRVANAIPQYAQLVGDVDSETVDAVIVAEDEHAKAQPVERPAAMLTLPRGNPYGEADEPSPPASIVGEGRDPLTDDPPLDDAA